MDGIRFYAIRFETEEDTMEACEHFSMNGYTYDTNCEKTVFVFDEEISYAMTYLEDNGIPYTIL